MISEKLQKAINEQITAEMWSSNLYLAMSFYFEKEGFSGFAHWMKKQSQEEMGHAYAMADYIIKRGGTAIVDKIDVVPNGWGTPLEVFEHVYKHECHVSALVDKLVDVAAAEKDKATQDFLWGFVREQVEEEATAQGIVDKIKKAGDTGIFFVDSQLDNADNDLKNRKLYKRSCLGLYSDSFFFYLTYQLPCRAISLSFLFP